MRVDFDHLPPVRPTRWVILILACFAIFIFVGKYMGNWGINYVSTAYDDKPPPPRPWFVKNRPTKHPTEGRLVWVSTVLDDKSGNRAWVDLPNNVVLITPIPSYPHDYLNIPRDSWQPLSIKTSSGPNQSVCVAKDALIYISQQGYARVFKVGDPSFAEAFFNTAFETDKETGYRRLSVEDFVEWVSKQEFSVESELFNGEIGGS